MPTGLSSNSGELTVLVGFARRVGMLAMSFLVPVALMLPCSCSKTHVEGHAPGECSDRADNDGDGLYDCGDPDCAGAPVCLGDDDDSSGDDDVSGDDDDGTGSGDDDAGNNVEFDCTDGVDDDGDGLVDCADPDCAADPACSGDDDTSSGPQEDCINGVDDDEDGDVDCADPDCACDLNCGGTGTESEVGSDDLGCADDIDGDCDGLIDCKDHDCEGHTLCPDQPGSEGYPPCCDTMTCPNNDVDCLDNPAWTCQQPILPWSGDGAGDGPDHCGDFNPIDCISCYDGLDGDNDGGADCDDPEALAIQASGDLGGGVPNCYYVRLCDEDTSRACP